MERGEGRRERKGEAAKKSVSHRFPNVSSLPRTSSSESLRGKGVKIDYVRLSS